MWRKIEVHGIFCSMLAVFCRIVFGIDRLESRLDL
jgi:hypothetical protein